VYEGTRFTNILGPVKVTEKTPREYLFRQVCVNYCRTPIPYSEKHGGLKKKLF
jgi:hypothetical protein